MSAVPLDLHQNDLQGKPVHCDQYMIQFLIVKPLTTKVASFLSLKQSSRTKPLSPDKTLAGP